MDARQILLGDPALWALPVGARIAEYLRDDEAVIKRTMDAVAHVPDAVLVTGEFGEVRGILGPALDAALDAALGPVARTTESHVTAAVDLRSLLIKLVAGRRIALAVDVLREHGARGEGRVLVVCLGDITAVAKMGFFDVELPDGATVAEGGDS